MAMAEKISEYVDSPVVPTTYPNGKLLDESAPGANDGTLVRNVHVQDMWNVFAKAMDDTGTAFDTNPDTQTSSQFFDALTALMHPVGATMQAFMTEAQFNAQPGFGASKWVLSDGRNVAGSKYNTITGLTTVPNAAGKVLRSDGGSSAALRASQTQQMGTHNHNIAHVHQWSYRSTLNSLHFLHTNDSSSTLITASDQSMYGTTEVTPITGSKVVTPNQQGVGLNAYSTGVLSPPTGSDGATAASSSVTTGSTETRMDNVTVNTFIKIN